MVKATAFLIFAPRCPRRGCDDRSPLFPGERNLARAAVGSHALERSVLGLLGGSMGTKSVGTARQVGFDDRSFPVVPYARLLKHFGTDEHRVSRPYPSEFCACIHAEQ